MTEHLQHIRTGGGDPGDTGAPAPLTGEERQRLEDRIDELFFDHREARVWKKQAPEHLYLCWIRATLDMDADDAVAYEVVPAATGSAGLDEDVCAWSRANAYSLFARAFCEPDVDLAERVARGEYHDKLKHALKPWSSIRAVDEGLELLRGSLSLPLESDAALDELLTAYTGLFLDSELPFIPPYESIYLGERQVMGECAAAVQRMYAAMDLGVVGTELPDHVMHECEFMEYMAAGEAGALQAGAADKALEYREAGLCFIDQHLLAWGARFCSDIQSLDPHPFYAGVGMAFYGFLSAERDYVASASRSARDD